MAGEAKKVILLGSSALKIGEAVEFDYSGSQFTEPERGMRMSGSCQ